MMERHKRFPKKYEEYLVTFPRKRNRGKKKNKPSAGDIKRNNGDKCSEYTYTEQSATQGNYENKQEGCVSEASEDELNFQTGMEDNDIDNCEEVDNRFYCKEYEEDSSDSDKCYEEKLHLFNIKPRTNTYKHINDTKDQQDSFYQVKVENRFFESHDDNKNIHSDYRKMEENGDTSESEHFDKNVHSTVDEEDDTSETEKNYGEEHPQQYRVRKNSGYSKPQKSTINEQGYNHTLEKSDNINEHEQDFPWRKGNIIDSPESQKIDEHQCDVENENSIHDSDKCTSDAESSSAMDENMKSEFKFQIPHKEWIQLPFVDKPTYRRLGGNWTDVFAKHFNVVQPHCVLIFKYNRIAKSKRAVLYGQFPAKCKHSKCNASYKMTIADKPETEDVIVHVSRIGEVSEHNEERSRLVRGSRRDQMKKELETKSPLLYRSELLVDANTRELNAGNFTAVPTKDVLKQVRAEERQYEKLSDCVVREVYAVKRTLEILCPVSKPVKGYIQYIGYDPFFVINFCAEQINLLTEACQEEDAFLYFDATGLSMKRPFDQPKRLYMYCLVLQTRRHMESIRVAEMMTNDHSTPSILNFLMRIRHAVTTNRQYRAPRKIETDFSFAMIHSACRAFNSCDLITYLTKCWDIISTDTVMTARMTVLHICAAHMMKIFQKMVVKFTERSQTKKFWMFVLARLQTASTLETATVLVRDITAVCKSSIVDKRVNKALNSLQTAIQLINEDIVDEANSTYYIVHEEHDGTLRAQSPFYEYFANTVSNAYVSSDADGENPYHNPSLIATLLKDYLPFLPLWSGLLLSEHRRNIIEGSIRDTNAVVERQFATLKNEVLHKERNMNPGKACRLLYVSATGLAKCALVRSRKRKYKDDTQEKEKWQKSSLMDKKKKKRSKYFSAPTKKEIDKMSFAEKEITDQESCDDAYGAESKEKKRNIAPQRTSTKRSEVNNQSKLGRYQSKKTFIASPSKCFTTSFDFTDANAMPWGGFDKKRTGISLSNTCTIDNILTAMYIIICSRSDVAQKLSASNDTATQVVLEICFNEMMQQKWTEAKLKFVTDLLKKRGTNIDLFGTEFEMAIKYLVRPQRHTTKKIARNVWRAGLQNTTSLNWDLARRVRTPSMSSCQIGNMAMNRDAQHDVEVLQPPIKYLTKFQCCFSWL